MSKFLLDTNIVSELSKPHPNRHIAQFIHEAEVSLLSVMTLHEITYGASLLEEGKRKDKIIADIEKIEQLFSTSILAIDDKISKKSAYFRAEMYKKGKVLHVADSIIAATAERYHLTLATRNVKDFQHLEIKILNPF